MIPRRFRFLVVLAAGLFWARSAAPRQDSDELAAEAMRELERGRADRALQVLEGELGRSPPSEIDSNPRRLTREGLRARCLFELGDYPRCEVTLRRLLEALPESSAEYVEYLGRLANVLSLEEVPGEALATIDRAVRLRDSVPVRRLAVTLALRARRYPEVRPHVEALLEVDAEDRYARFARGIVRAREGRFTAAREDLRWGLKIPGAEREARFELALVESKLGRPHEALDELGEILKKDPYDQEACYQAAQQLIRVGGSDAVTVAAQLTRYLEGIKEVLGSSSRRFHARAEGRGAEAALLEARRWERVGEYGAALRALRRARGLAVESADTASVLGAQCAFWLRMGLLHEARRALDSAKRGFRDEGADHRSALLGLERALAEATKRLDRDAEDPLLRARRRVAQLPWGETETALEELLEAAIDAGATALADRSSRLLIAQRPASRPALRHLVERTREPSLLVPHVHYLARLAAADPGNSQWTEELRRLSSRFRGEGAGR